DLVLRRAQGDFYGGRLTGSFEAVLTAAPAYTFNAAMNPGNLCAFAAATPTLGGPVSGKAFGEMLPPARGGQSRDPLGPLTGTGEVRARDAMVRGINFAFDNRGAETTATEGRFNEVAAKFRVAAGKIHLDESLFSSREGQFQATGDLDFARGLNLSAQSVG